MGARATILDSIGGEAACQRLAEAFYARVAKDDTLRPLFPFKTLRCATEEFSAFLVQFLDGDEEQTQHRWWLSLHESHSRFSISAAQRAAWLRLMQATVEESPFAEPVRKALLDLFHTGANYVTNKEPNAAHQLTHEELAPRWARQRLLDDTVAAMAAGRDAEAIANVARLSSRPSVLVGLIGRMMQSGRPALAACALETIGAQPALLRHRFAGRTLLHLAAAAGSLDAVALLLKLGADPNEPDRGGHPPLYSVANECSGGQGAAIVRALVAAGAQVNQPSGVTGATPLHMAARRGHLEIARALLDSGAAVSPRDRKGDTPLKRARNCRRPDVARLLEEHGAR